MLEFVADPVNVGFLAKFR